MRAVQRALVPKKGLSVSTSNTMAGEQTQAKYHLNRQEPVVEKGRKPLNPNQFHSQLGGTNAWGRTTPGPEHTQLPMFMSAKEISKHYQVLDGDRDWVETRTWGRDERDHEVMRRKYYEANQYSAAGTSGDKDYRTKGSNSSSSSSSGSDWAMDDGFDAYDHVYDGHDTLADSVRAHGVEKPITLEAPKVSYNYGGSQGKPQIYGGHHRLAVMKYDRPNVLMPVQFGEDFWSERQRKDYR